MNILGTIYCVTVLLFLAEFWSRLAESRRMGYLAALIFLVFSLAQASFWQWAFSK